MARPGGVVDDGLCAVSSFLTVSVIKFEAMKTTLANLWHLHRILEGQSLDFNSHLLVFHRLQLGEDLLAVSLVSVEFWVQIQDLPSSLILEDMAQQFGNFLGPLKRRKKIILATDRIIYARFQYKRLPVFCFFCGRLGNSKIFCPIWIIHSKKEMSLEWDLMLRATPKQALVGTSCWFKEEGAISKLNDIRRSFCNGLQTLRELLLIMLLFGIIEYWLDLRDRAVESHETPKLEYLVVREPSGCIVPSTFVEEVETMCGFFHGNKVVE
ncbi:hypothetical protein Golob_014687 [Gossypium lobatum]|uniref:Zinc knuckle CX2CX4HX4C domain-containing protein n=1 Tax=Gossypium lobatum TaxID=34289 RepID=A0A7J8LYW6_9ROSI|nr:hypothetical protein [Gossypium lobatum]